MILPGFSPNIPDLPFLTQWAENNLNSVCFPPCNQFIKIIKRMAQDRDERTLYAHLSLEMRDV